MNDSILPASPQETPSAPVGDGRSANGRFAAGNRFAQGNPHARRAQRLRSALYEAVSDEDLRAVVETLVREAKGGSIAAIRELLNRLLGPPEAIDLVARLEATEERLREVSKAGMP